MMTEAERQVVIEREAERLVDATDNPWAKIPKTRKILIHHARAAIVKAIKTIEPDLQAMGLIPVKVERRGSPRGSVGDLLKNEAGKWGETGGGLLQRD